MGYGIGYNTVSHGHVVKRTVGFDVLQGNTVFAGNIRKGVDLSRDEFRNSP